MSLYEASVEGLRARTRGLDTDLKRWVARGSDTGNLKQHRSQLERLQTFLKGTLSAVVQDKVIDPAKKPPFTGTVDDIAGLRRSVGSVHLMWEFFRDKLAQRDIDGFTAHLGAADDLAYACYDPFLAAATTAGNQVFSAAEVKESPLVFYSTDRTPFAQARAKTLHPDGLDAKDLADFEVALQRLPVPVIGMPWDIANRMPETALVGHEAGHVIAEDLGFAAEARTAIEQAVLPDDPGDVRKRVWQAWTGEVFADVIGVLATGSAFVEGLTAELADNKKDVQLATINPDKPGKYPTRMLRVALCEELLRGIGVAPSTAWSDTYGKVDGNSRDYVADIPVVAKALLKRPWECVDGELLDAILPWNADLEAKAKKVGDKVLKQQSAPVLFDVRIWVAASMHAYRTDPATYAELDLDKVLAEHIVGRREVEVRSSRVHREPLVRDRSVAPADADKQMRDADRRAGLALARELGLA